MNDIHRPASVSNRAPEWDTSSHEDFFKYYELESAAPQTVERFRRMRDTVLRLRAQQGRPGQLDVLDVGCGAGAQASLWVDLGHRYHGLDINQPLIELARRRAAEKEVNASFDVGSATALAWPDASFDICLLPELLEHVADWEGCIREAMRVLRPGGLMYINTSNKLCPRQQEFNLPLYSWYPGVLKRYFEQRAVTDWPSLANYAKYPAVNWFSFYSLRKHLAPFGFECSDRFDLTDTAHLSPVGRMALAALTTLAPARLMGHVLTPYTLVVATKAG